MIFYSLHIKIFLYTIQFIMTIQFEFLYFQTIPNIQIKYLLLKYRLFCIT